MENTHFFKGPSGRCLFEKSDDYTNCMEGNFRNDNHCFVSVKLIVNKSQNAIHHFE